MHFIKGCELFTHMISYYEHSGVYMCRLLEGIKKCIRNELIGICMEDYICVKKGTVLSSLHKYNYIANKSNIS